MRIDRLNNMEAYVAVKGSASFDELAAAFSVSKNTARRDVDELVQKGRLQKTYGGVSVSPSQSTVLSTSWASRREVLWEEKKRIAALAATLVQDGHCLFLDAGTTAFAMLEYMAIRRNVTIITDSLPVMVEAAQQPALKIFGLGGLYSRENSSFQGENAVEVIQQLNADIAFIGTSAISLDCGLSNSTYHDALLKRKIIERFTRVVLLADASKFDRRALFSFGDLNQLDVVVTNQRPPEAYCEYFAKHDVELLVP